MFQWQPPSGLCSLHLFPLISTGAKNPSHIEKNRPVFRICWLCEADHTERGSYRPLQGLFAQHAQYCPVRWHRSGRLWGQETGKVQIFHTWWKASLLFNQPKFFFTDPEVFLAEQKQRGCRSGGDGPGWLWCCLQHMWTTGELPTSTNPHPDASTRWGWLIMKKDFWIKKTTRMFAHLIV